METVLRSQVCQDLTESQKRLLAPFVKCTKDVFSMMLNWDVSLVGVVTNDEDASRHDCSGIIGISGELRGSIVVSVDQDVALEATASFLGEKPTSINSDVFDTVRELANMVGGSSKDQMGVPGLMLGLPTVVCGRGHIISFENGAHVEMLQFTSPHGPFTVEVALVGLGELR